jgi:outer membrane lipase/esterase
MRQTNFALALVAAAVLTACGGSDSNNAAAPAKPTFAAQVSFGDSLSDVGTYAVGTVAALGGGKYTINGNNIAINAALHGKNWTELMAAQMSLAAPCPAVTGLDGVAAQGFAVPVVDHPTCFSYAQGGSRVTNPVGPGNKLTGAAIGQLTYPVVTQVATHLQRAGGLFKSTDIVYVWAGGNDLLFNLGSLTAAATAAGTTAGGEKFISSLATSLAAGATSPTAAYAAIATAMATEAARAGSTSTTLVQVAVGTAAVQPGNSAVASPAVYGPKVTAAQADAAAAGTAAANAYAAANGPALVPVMAQAGAELANLIRTQIVGKGATHVVLVNLPDVATSTPSGLAQSASAKQLIAGMVSGFNIALRVGIDGLEDKVLYIDLFTQSQDQFANPTKYGISNATTPACGANPLGTTSLVCKASNTLAGVDVSHYIFADDVHPAPYGQTLIAKAVADAMISRGWL